MIKIKVNNRTISVKKNCPLNIIKKKYAPRADLVIYKGAVITKDRILKNNDELIFIKKGVISSAQKLKYMLFSRNSPDIYKTISQKHIGIAGIGGLGSSVAVALARTGIGKLTLVDYDVIEPSNLNRQYYFIEQIGMPKVKALSDTIKKITPYTRVFTRQVRLNSSNIRDIFNKIDLLIEGFDNPNDKLELFETFNKFYPKTPIILASGLAGIGRSNKIKTSKLGKKIYIIGDQTSAAREGVGLMAPRVGIAAHHQANIALELLTK
jgi:sulfur carrier protein ThiS adenylyltransferase